MIKTFEDVKNYVRVITYRAFCMIKYFLIKISGKYVIYDNNNFYIEGQDISLEERHSRNNSIEREMFRHEMYIIDLLDIPVKKVSRV